MSPSESSMPLIAFLLFTHARLQDNACTMSHDNNYGGTTLAAATFISTLEIRYEQLYYGILLIFNVWVFIKMLRSEVMA